MTGNRHLHHAPRPAGGLAAMEPGRRDREQDDTRSHGWSGEPQAAMEPGRRDREQVAVVRAEVVVVPDGRNGARST